MTTEPNRDPAAASPIRRTIIAGLGLGIGAAAVGFWKWPHPGQTVKTAAAPKPVTARSTSSSSTPIAEEVPAAAAAESTQHFSREAFLAHLKSSFAAVNHDQPGGMTLKLTEVSAAQLISSKTEKFSGFSLIFDAPQGTPSIDGLYEISHAEMGKMEIYLSPVGKYVDRIRYEAVFSQKI